MVNNFNDNQLEENKKQEDHLDMEQYDVLKTIGKGGFASVCLCVHKPSSQYFALKMLSQKACKAKQVEHVKCEMEILQGIGHPFLVPLLKTSMEGIRPILLFPYVSGGSLYAQLKKARKFPTATVLFFSAEIVSALSYLHSLSIVHRDLKPKNILLDKQGHVVIIDFGFSKKIQQRSSTMCGTQAYLAPEIIECVGHDKAVDWWALGIISYEMLVGYPPFFDDNPFLVSEKILSEKLKWPRRMDTVAKDVIEKLLDRDTRKRLGSKDIGGEEVKQHKFFTKLDWEDVYHKRLKPPIVPKT
jgi:serine/threonine protein kinase